MPSAYNLDLQADSSSDGGADGDGCSYEAMENEIAVGALNCADAKDSVECGSPSSNDRKQNRTQIPRLPSIPSQFRQSKVLPRIFEPVVILCYIGRHQML